MPRGGALTVVKLGGSHAFSPHLRGWVEALADCGRPLVVVPGGGPFADTVRSAQPKIGFGDRAAHRMALLAMEQYGCALASLDPRLVLAASERAIRLALSEGRVPVWLPARMVLAAAEIPWSWDVTSDSLAAWLAGRLGAQRLVLVKHAATGPRVGAGELARKGVVDPLFPSFLAGSGVAAYVVGPCEPAAALAGGAPIDLDEPAPDDAE